MIYKFTKMQGGGNDYIYINAIEYKINDPEEKSKLWSAYHTGIGSDGLILIEASDKADFKMRIFNADGSEGMMCGNGCRCIGKYVYEKGLTDKTNVSLETLSGIKYLHLHIDRYNKVETVTVDMGEPEILEQKLILDVENESYQGTAVSMGNPHYIIMVKNMDDVNLSHIGPLLERHPHFPNRTNVEFVQYLKDKEVRMRVWERGSGITQACGTGACATTAALVANKIIDRGDEVKIIMDGGPLSISWSDVDNHIYMTGGAEFVFEGTVEG